MSNRVGRYDLDLDEIKRMYLSGKTAEQIAAHYGVSGCPIYRRLTAMGITRNNSESHAGIQKKENNPNWKGGKWVDSMGYVTINHFDKPVREHRLIAERMLGRKLQRGEVVHHKNGDKTDNREENLEVFKSHSEHMKLHMTSEEARIRGSRKAALLSLLKED